MSERKSSPEELLVAIDFSPCSLRALDTALAWRTATAEVTILHVLDADFVAHIDALGLGSADELITRLRSRAEEELAQVLAERNADRVESMIVVGTPFVEIVKIANDLECDLIVIGIQGQESGLKQLLFGGTAEKVLRGAKRPVLCVP
jgi:nucleotide-binding universal stress UspA family protein